MMFSVYDTRWRECYSFYLVRLYHLTMVSPCSPRPLGRVASLSARPDQIWALDGHVPVCRYQLFSRLPRRSWYMWDVVLNAPSAIPRMSTGDSGSPASGGRVCRTFYTQPSFLLSSPRRLLSLGILWASVAPASLSVGLRIGVLQLSTHLTSGTCVGTLP